MMDKPNIHTNKTFRFNWTLALQQLPTFWSEMISSGTSFLLEEEPLVDQWVVISLRFFLMTGTNADKAWGAKRRRVKTSRTAKTHGEELRCRCGAPAGVCAQSLRPLIKEWFIEASQRELLGNLSSEWDFSSERGRVNQTWRREACEAQQ